MIQEWDFSVLNFIQEHMRCGFLDTVMPGISFLGNASLIWIVIAVILLFRKETRRWGILLVIGLCMNGIVSSLFIKNLVARDRPCWINQDIVLLIKSPKDYSFPSGHSFGAFVSAVILLGWNKKAGIAALVLALLIAFSRLYLYVHFPTDVICGTLLGVLFGVMILVVNKRLTKKNVIEVTK